MGALGAGLALPFCIALAAPAGDFPGVDAMPEAASTPPARWREYALASITPQFSWAVRPEAVEVPQVLDNYSGRLTHLALFAASAEQPFALSISVGSATVSDTPAAMPDRSGAATRVRAPGLQRTVVSPTLTREWGDGGNLQLTGVLAHQRFASLGLGTAATAWLPRTTWSGPASYGAGARVELGNAFGEHWRWRAAYQSRVAMGVVGSYMGVFGEPGRFDIPASASLGLSYAVTPGLSLELGVQRVMYSGVAPFTSPNLPRRFLALLGDSTSPGFAWDDLDVYSVGWSWRSPAAGTFDVRLTSRQQPLPTSRQLRRALDDGIAKGMLELGWSRDFGANASLGIGARYASSPYYLMLPTWQPRPGATAGRFEFEALWSARF